MFISFDPLVFLVWLFISTFIPGTILSFSIFRKHDFNFIEKLFIGFTLGFVLLPLIPFLIYLIIGITFSSTMAYVSIVLLYVAALVLFVKNKVYEDVISKAKSFKFTYSKEMLLPLLLLLILLITYVIRVITYSPIFQELDPYFYTYTAQQLLTIGYNPAVDWVAWYPEVATGHRIIPTESYLESIWYVLSTGGTAYNNMSLALVASMYPPIAAVLTVFFVYLLLSRVVDKKWAVITAGLVSFLPVFVYKLSAGEQGVEPYALFSLAFLYAFYVISLKKKDIRLPTLKEPFNFGSDAIYPVMAGLAFFALTIGSLSQIVGLTSIMIFVVGQSILLFLREKDEEKLRHFILVNAIFFVVGPLLGTGIIYGLFEVGKVLFSMPAAMFIAIAFAGVLLAIKKFLPDRTQSILALGILLVLGVIVYALTPVGGLVKGIGQQGFGFAQFLIPLDRTIAEQNLAATDLSSQLGFIAQSYSIPPVLDSPQSIVNLVIYVVLAPFSIISNLVINLGVSVTNFILGTTVTWADKDVSLMLFWIFLFLCSLVYCLWKFMNNEDDAMFMFFLAIIMPPTVVGLLKIKYTIYAAVLIAVSIGFSFGQLESLINNILKDENEKKSYQTALIAVGMFFLLFQFLYQGFVPSLIWGSSQTLYQNNPAALAAKFQSFCATTNASDVCGAAADPLGYASKGTNYQYDENLCLLSVFSDPSYLQNPGNAPQWEAQAAFFRCQRLADYWVDSMEWISHNTENGSRITSWWDYGHWINFFGQRNTVLRNDQHTSPSMVGSVAYDYVDGTPNDLKSFMKAHDSRYALFDIELISSGGQLGGKYGALNYLSCAEENQTTVAQAPGESQCEANNLWETVFISQTPCTISSLTNRTGVTAYKIYAGQIYLSYYPSICYTPQSANDIAYCQDVIQAVPTYCVGNVTLASGQSTYGLYYLNETYPNGDLKLNKGILMNPFQLQATSHMGPVTGATVFYTEDPIWIENGVVTSGYDDRKGDFYDSAIYRALFLDDLPGFKLVYSTPNGGAVKIYEINDSSNSTTQ